MFSPLSLLVIFSNSVVYGYEADGNKLAALGFLLLYYFFMISESKRCFWNLEVDDARLAPWISLDPFEFERFDQDYLIEV